ncbi:hypothetical protein TRAPUB_5578 [Trametes pubescens]|uniref:Uncharacterized protein n=1 Tax=Trametes pubescens TaxID=154538 RepID=A0A1M2V8D0_TRAPU|nr:hypothetical protein TRAPUB_5578 [Trametes pubescens]
MASVVADRAKIAAAAQRNVQTLRKREPARVLYISFDNEYEVRQRFRKRIDRDILGTHSDKHAVRSLETVLKLAENILAAPTDPGVRRFKVSNNTIKKLVIEPKGVLQLVVDVEDFVPYYVFRGNNVNELRIGASMIKEALVRERKQLEDEKLKHEREEAERKAHEEKIHKNFMDDRLSVAARAQRERHSGYVKGILRPKGLSNGTNIVTLHGKAAD